MHTNRCTRIAYSTVGNGPPFVKTANWFNHLEYEWKSPVWRHWIAEISRQYMFVRYNERGCGLSDWHVQDLSFDAWVRDQEAVVDALSVERFALLDISQGGAVAAADAARHPERVSHLILLNAYARGWQLRGDPAEIEARTALRVGKEQQPCLPSDLHKPFHPRCRTPRNGVVQ